MKHYNQDKPHRCPECHASTLSVRDGTLAVVLDKLDHKMFVWSFKIDDAVMWKWHYHPAKVLGGVVSKLLMKATPNPLVLTLTFASVTCCMCGTEFTRWPNLPVLRRRGILCDTSSLTGHGHLNGETYDE